MFEKDSAGSEKVQELVPIISGKVNVADYLEIQARKQPYQRAVIVPDGRDKEGKNLYSHLTYDQLNNRTDSYAWKMEEAGVTFGDRVIVGIRPGIDLVAVTFSLFKVGAVPVFIDPGMGKEGLLNCIKQAKARVMVAEFKAHLLSYVYKDSFSAIEVFLNVGKAAFGRMKSLKGGMLRYEPFEIVDTKGEDLAAILFTSGSTGPAKGVLYTHSTFAHQIKMIRQTYKVTEQDVDMSIFPLFALFAVSMGMPTVIPDMDTSRPLSADPCKICRVILDQGVTFSFGSPTFWDKMAGFCLEKGIVLPSLRALLMAGCSVPGDLHERFLDHLLPPGGDVYVPYGATESLPLTTFSGSEVLMKTRELSDNGAGTCVGKKISDKVEIRIIKISDEEIHDWDESLALKPGEIGEIVVKGVIVTKAYFERPDANAKAKIREGRYIWHRMGDVGYVDKDGMLWFCGRKVDRVTLKDAELYTDQCENIFNTHNAVRRSALIGINGSDGNKQAAIVVEPQDKTVLGDQTALDKLENELLSLAKSFDKTTPVETVFFRKTFPVDVRHNAKIKREILTAWADSLPKR